MKLTFPQIEPARLALQRKHKRFRRIRRLWEKIEHVYWKAVPYDYRPSRLWYKLKCIVWHRYTVIKPRYLPLTWCDRCTVLPHMMFEILSQFIERECSPGIVEWYGKWGHKIVVNGEEKYVRDEMQDLYDWWHNIYNKEYERVDNVIWEEAGKCGPVGDWSDPLMDENGDVYAYRWNPKYENNEKKAMHRMLMQSLNRLEVTQHEDLEDKMIRLCRIRGYLWT